jgi:glycosyltransferase A (GT-A) superfamily protein (DUF2064 family)
MYIISNPISFSVRQSHEQRCSQGRKKGIQWRMMGRLQDLDFADDICLLA